MTSLDDLATKCRVDRAIITAVVSLEADPSLKHYVYVVLLLRSVSSILLACLCLVLRQAGHELLS
jgi:hypothetical protein